MEIVQQTKLTFPVRNSLVPQSNLMLTSTPIMLDKIVPEDFRLPCDALRVHHSRCGSFQRGGQHLDL